MTVNTASLKSRFKLIILLCVLLFSTQVQLRGQDCTCTNCPQFMPDNFVGNFLITVMGATNATLGQNGQGVCGVNLSFDHEYLGDLSILLTSPSGQSVQLVGPIGLFGSTDFTTWNVGFVPCGDVANPDPGFAAQWNNNQAWGLFGNYSGSYYPSNGCLENFNSGPVNGTWTLTVTDGQAVDVGNFFNYEIIFCDPSGINCFSCAADAGNLPQPDVNACQGAPNLSLNLPPTYTPPQVAPPPADYGYTYVISGTGGVILAYEDNPDLTSYDPGSYSVCGLSYLAVQDYLIPPPNGSLTITQLTNQLASSTPPFCGDVTGNCVNVTINTAPPDEEEFETVCAPKCYMFHNQNYCQSGDYTRTLMSPQGCTYTAVLHLTVYQPSIKNIVETICVGGCSTTPGFESYCGQGNYQEIFMNSVGCDSIVNVNLVPLAVVANIQPPGQLSCTQTTMQLLGVGSSTGATVTYLWTASNGGNIVGGSTSLTALVNMPGTYHLKVCKSGGGVTCCDSTQVDVTADQDPPPPPAAVTGLDTLCQGQTLSYTATTVLGVTNYIWTVPAGVTINSGQNTQTINVTWNSATGGSICAASNNLCGTSTPTCIDVAVNPLPVPILPTGAANVCAGAVEAYAIPPAVGATNYTWSVTGGGTITSGQGTTSIMVTWSNTSGTVCVNATGSCGTSQDVCLPVTVTAIPATPVITGPAVNCPGNNAAYTISPVPGSNSYNWQVTNGTVSIGQGTNSVQVSWNGNAVSGTVCANAANACGNSPDSCMNVNLSIPLGGTLTTTCDSTNEYYTVSFPITGGTAPYTIPGGTITGGVFTSDPIPNGAMYSFVIEDANLCASAGIFGNFTCACSTDAGTMSLTPLTACEDQTVTATHQGDENLDGNDIGAYVLHTNPGPPLGTVLGENTTGTFGFLAGMSYNTTYYISYVAGTNMGGVPNLADPCLSVSEGQPAMFFQNPVANAGLDADTCGLALILQGNATVGTGTWTLTTVPSGGNLTISDIQDPLATATANGFGQYILTWTLDNNGCMDADTVALTFHDFPAATNLVQSCDAANENYTVSFQITGGTPNYNITGTPNGTGTGSSYTSVPIANGGNYSYIVTDNSGCSSPPITGTFSCNCATDAGTMEVAQLTTCEGGTVSAVHLGGENLDGNDIGGYFLHSGSGSALGTIYAQNTTGTFGFQAGMTYGTTYYISYVVGNNLNGSPDLADFCLSVSVGQPVIFYSNPIPNAGVDLDTCGTVLSLNGSTLPSGVGQWTVTGGTAANLTINQPSNPLSVVSATMAGTYTLTWTVTQNGCVGADQVDIQYNNSPTLANLVRTCDATNDNFTVTLTLAGGTAPYSVNGTPAVGTVFTSSPFPNGQSYIFNVTDANGCTMPAVTGAFSCNCATNAGTMPLQPLSTCQGTSITAKANSNQVLDANDVTSYVLHNGAGPALGQVFAQNTTGTFSFQAGMSYETTYYISIVAGNPTGTFPNPQDPCFSVAPGQPVVWHQNPVPSAGPDDSVCGETINLAAVGAGYSGVWTKVVGQGTANFAAATSPTSAVTVSANGLYTFQWTETNFGCVGSDQVIIRFNPKPTLTGLGEICNGTNTQFTVTFTAASGTAPFVVNGLPGTFAGSVFTSAPLASAANYSFQLVDANGCTAPSVVGAHVCNCSTDAGSMQTAPAIFCANTPATGVWDNNGNTDADDIIQFILHSTPGSTLGTIYATNSLPSFNFSSNLQTDVTYYISAIAGNNVGGNVDVTDLCLSISPGVPVQWKPMPTATLSGSATLCSGDATVLTYSGTGTYPLTVTYLDGGVQNNLLITSTQPVSVNLTPTATTTFSLLSVVDGTLPGCSTTLNQTVTLTVNQPVNAGTANDPVEFCAGVDLPIVLSNLITGADFGGQWTETSAVLSSAGAFNAAIGTFQTTGQAPGTYKFRYLLTTQAPCVNDEETATIIIHPIPVADAGENKAINCDQTTVTLGGGGTTAGIYSWMLDTLSVGNTRQIFVTTSGTYTLHVTNAAGCSDEDDVNVILDNQVPIAEAISVNGVRCFGEDNGAISIDSVSAAHFPVLYSLNGGAFQSSPLFPRLQPGNYTVTLMDPNGCESTTTQLMVVEPPELFASLGADIEAALSDSVHLKVEATVPVSTLASIFWQPLLDSTLTKKPDEQNFMPLHSWQVKVTIIDSNGCVAYDEVLIRVDKPRNVFIPNIFNPESGRDPVLYIFGGKDVAIVESFLIFDRWGTMLFEQKDFLPNDPSYGWDGRFKGELLNPGVFVYQAAIRFIDGEKILFKGDITLIR